MQALWTFLGELVNTSSVTSAVVLAALMVTKPFWLGLVQLWGEWVRTMPDRRRASDEAAAVRRALEAEDKASCDRAYRVLKLLRETYPPPLAPPNDLPAAEGEP
ncbi:MAG: hypothetical protein ABIQ18_00565 [Umezawaea sp.]